MIDLIAKKYLFFIFSGLIIIPGTIALILWGLKPAVDFTGGSLIEFQIKNASKEVLKEDIKKILVDAIKKLPKKEYMVIALYYYEELTLKEIGEVLGVTESRVSQLHTKAVLHLKSRLMAHKEILM